ncbi:MAG: penicillin-binding protein 2 [Synergistaceae bacterium]|nr:penicillin-binding protein 2 [Synergistota bacterium]NLM71686.1 penicillin-binding protein 2 [Synergistaceae bacterium]
MSDQRSLINRRLLCWRWFLLFILLVLVGWLYYFQIVKVDTYVRLGANNRLRFIRYAPIRGEIVDRNGVPVAANVTTFDIMGYPLDIEKDGMIERLSLLLMRHGIPLTDRDLYKEIKRQSWAPYRVVRVVSGITLAQMAELVADPEFPRQLFPIPVLRRTYPAGGVAANVTGFVGEISESELRLLESKGYVGGDHIGKSGIEKQYEEILRGKPGGESVEVDSKGRKIRRIDSYLAGRGEDLKLTLDLGAQRLATELLKDRRGAMVVMDVHDGDVLVLVSSPSYDNNPLSWGVSSTEWNALLNDSQKPMLDRSIAGLYPPASTFKALVGLAALAEKEVSSSTLFSCSGAFPLGNRVFRCWRRTGHGRMNLVTALQYSCDIYFYQVGLKVGITKLLKWADMLGLGKPTGIDLPGEASGVIAGPEWKKARLKESWYKGDTVNYSIGQGFLLTTPLQLATLYAAIANGGKVVRPRLAERAPKQSVDLNIDQEHLKIIRKGLDFVVRRGTAQRAGSFGITVAGKTGTAQNAHGADHALFVGYAPMDDPKYVGVAMLEAGLHGGSVASPMVGEMLSYLLVPSSRVKQP